MQRNIHLHAGLFSDQLITKVITQCEGTSTLGESHRRSLYSMLYHKWVNALRCVGGVPIAHVPMSPQPVLSKSTPTADQRRSDPRLSTVLPKPYDATDDFGRPGSAITTEMLQNDIVQKPAIHDTFVLKDLVTQRHSESHISSSNNGQEDSRILTRKEKKLLRKRKLHEVSQHSTAEEDLLLGSKVSVDLEKLSPDAIIVRSSSSAAINCNISLSTPRVGRVVHILSYDEQLHIKYKSVSTGSSSDRLRITVRCSNGDELVVPWPHCAISLLSGTNSDQNQLINTSLGEDEYEQTATQSDDDDKAQENHDFLGDFNIENFFTTDGETKPSLTDPEVYIDDQLSKQRKTGRGQKQLLVTGERISSAHVQEIENYFTNLQKSAERPNIIVAPTPTVSEELHYEDDPLIPAKEPDVILIGKVKDFIKCDSDWSISMRDVYIKDTKGSSSGKDLILPVVNINIDGRSLFAPASDK